MVQTGGAWGAAGHNQATSAELAAGEARGATISFPHKENRLPSACSSKPIASSPMSMRASARQGKKQEGKAAVTLKLIRRMTDVGWVRRRQVNSQVTINLNRTHTMCENAERDSE